MTGYALALLAGVLIGTVFGLLAGWAAALSEIERWPRPRLDIEPRNVIPLPPREPYDWEQQ